MRLDGKPARQINELEWWRDRVVANVWYEHVILIINPETGLVEKEYGTFWHLEAFLCHGCSNYLLIILLFLVVRLFNYMGCCRGKAKS